MHCYLIGGLSVCSEITLPGLIDAPMPESPDVVVREGEVPLRLEHPTQSGPTWAMEEDRFLLQVPEIARFLLTGGREILFAKEAGAAERDVTVFLTGTVFGILMHQRGAIVLHASGIRVNGQAVLFCGPSGAGKSTIAAVLGQHGFPIVTDDFCALTLASDGTAMAQPDGRQLKLWAKAIDALGLKGGCGASVREKLEKYYFEPEASHCEPLPLGAVYALREARPPHVEGIERPNIVDCALIIRRNAYRPSLVRHMNQKPAYFHAAAKIANGPGIFHLTREFDLAKLSDIVPRLEGHWSEIGLTGSPS